MSDPATKLAEATFFLELFEALELRDDSMSHEHSKEAEASYLFSAVVGAFYAALDQWHRKTGNNKAYQAFKRLHPEIHGSTAQDGWRSVTVHLSHVSISETQFVTTNGLEAAHRKNASKLAQNEEVFYAPIEVHLSQYCVAYRGQTVPVLKFSRDHYQVLKQFIENT